MVPALILALTLSAEPPRAVVLVGRRTAMSAADAQALAQRISTTLTASRAPVHLDADAALAALVRLGVKDPAACTGRKACITELGRQLSATHVINLSLSQIGGDLAVALELMTVDTASVLERDALVLVPGTTPTAEQLAPFATRVRQQLAPDVPKVEAPPVVILPTPPVEPPIAVITPVPPPMTTKSRVVPITLGAAAVVALGVGATLLGTGLTARADAYRTEIVDGVARSPYPASQVQLRAQGATTQLAIAGGLGALAVGLGAGAVFTW